MTTPPVPTLEPEYLAALVRRSWESLRDTGEWLTRESLLVELSDRGLDPEQLVELAQPDFRWAYQPQRLIVSFGALTVEAGFAEFMAPLPELMRHAFLRWINQPPPGGSSGEVITLNRPEVARLWGEDADRAFTILERLELRVLRVGGIPPSQFVSASEDILRFESVMTLDDCRLALLGTPWPLQGTAHSEMHLEVVRRIWAQARTDLFWPLRIPFAIANRTVGYIPHVLAQLEQRKPQYTRTEYPDRVGLTLEALELVDPDQKGRALLAAAVRTAAELWVSTRNPKIRLADIAARAQVDEGELRRWALFFSMGAWPFGRLSDDRTFLDVHNTEALLRYRRCRNWSDLLAIGAPARPDESESPPATDLPAAPTAPTLEHRLAARGLTLGELLGRGGFGEVFAATHRLLGRRAVKVLRPSAFLTGEQVDRVLARFQREAEILDRISSPFVVRLHDVDFDHPPPFIVTAFVEGRTLDALGREAGAVPVPEALAIVESALEGLAGVHEHGVFHRDITPKNVLWDDRSRRAVLIDFGLSGFLEVISEERLTTTGGLGTPGYTAPELAANPRLQSPEVDLFSLCAVLHFLLVGRPPDHSNPAIRLQASDLPPPVVELVLGGIAQGRRYGSADAMRAALALVRMPDPTAGNPRVRVAAPSPPVQPERVAGAAAIAALRNGTPDRMLLLGEYLQGTAEAIHARRPEFDGIDWELKILAAYEGAAEFTSEFAQTLRVAFEVAPADVVLAKLIRFFEALGAHCCPTSRESRLGAEDTEFDLERLMLREMFLVAVDLVADQAKWSTLNELFSADFHLMTDDYSRAGKFPILELHARAPHAWKNRPGQQNFVSPTGEWLKERFEPSRLGRALSFDRLRCAELLATYRSLVEAEHVEKAWRPLCLIYSRPLWLFERARTETGAKALSRALGFPDSIGWVHLKNFWRERRDWPFEFFKGANRLAIQHDWLRVDDIASV